MSKLVTFKRSLLGAVSIASLAISGHASADLLTPGIDNSNAQAYIAVGNGDNSLPRADNLARITDPNTQASPFNGVVSLYMEIQGATYICTGSALNKRHILSAAHCVDENGQGQVMDLSDPNNDLLVVFNNDGAANDIIRAKKIDIHPDYTGFNVCADGSAGCIQDDIAIVELERDIPEGTTTYDLFSPHVNDTYNNMLNGVGGDGDIFTMVGYGTRGDGHSGFYTNDGDPAGSPDYFSKLVGYNIVDAFGSDDEGSGAMELWYADFDGTYTDVDGNFGTPNAEYDLDLFCDNFGICSSWLAEDQEANIGGGDSGGPSFIFNAVTGQYEIAGINTFGANTSPIAAGAFGSRLGGVLMNPYTQWITSQIPTPTTLALFGLAMLGLTTRRKKA